MISGHEGLGDIQNLPLLPEKEDAVGVRVGDNDVKPAFRLCDQRFAMRASAALRNMGRGA